MPSYRSANGSSYFNRPAPSSRRRSVRPRDGYVARIVERVKRMVKELYYYIRRNPVKVLLPIIMALISGGALHTIARKFGITIPAALAGLAEGSRGRGSFGFGHAFDESSRGSSLGDFATGGILQGAVKLASTFL